MSTDHRFSNIFWERDENETSASDLFLLEAYTTSSMVVTSMKVDGT